MTRISDKNIETIYGSISAVLVTVAIIIIYIFILSYPTMWLWNYVIPEVFGLPEINVKQSAALLLLLLLSDLLRLRRKK